MLKIWPCPGAPRSKRVYPEIHDELLLRRQLPVRANIVAPLGEVHGQRIFLRGPAESLRRVKGLAPVRVRKECVVPLVSLRATLPVHGKRRREEAAPDTRAALVRRSSFRIRYSRGSSSLPVRRGSARGHSLPPRQCRCLWNRDPAHPDIRSPPLGRSRLPSVWGPANFAMDAFATGLAERLAGVRLQACADVGAITRTRSPLASFPRTVTPCSTYSHDPASTATGPAGDAPCTPLLSRISPSA